MPAQAELKKWVDENGQVHYGDRIPAKYLKKEHYTINKQGLTVETTKAQKSEQQRKKEEEDKKLAKQRQKEDEVRRREQALRDRVLLDTFTTEKDLAIARDERLEAIDTQITLANTMVVSDEKKLESVKARIQNLETLGRNVPENLHKEVTTVSKQLENNQLFISQKNTEREKILENYEADVKRFRELKGDTTSSQP